MLFHRIIIRRIYLPAAIFLLFGCAVNYHGHSGNAASNDARVLEIRVCESMLDFTRKTAEQKNNFIDFKANKDFYGDETNFKKIYGIVADLTFEGILLVASFRDRYSDDCLLRIGSYYIGEAPGPYLVNLIIKRDKEILPALKKAKTEPADCDSYFYKCRYLDYYDDIIKIVNEQVEPNLTTDDIGDPFSYIPKERIEERFGIFLDKLNATRLLEK